MDSPGYLLTHEWTLYTFEAVPMLVVTVVFWYWYPGYIVLPPQQVDDEEGVELMDRGKFGMKKVVRSPWVRWMWCDMRGWNKV